MTTRIGMALALGAALAACGGSDHGNAAAGKQFTYDAPRTASGNEASAIDASVTSAQGLASSPDESAAQSFADFSAVTSALLGGDPVGLPTAVSPGADARTALFVARRAGVTATSGSFQNPGCVTKTLTSVTLAGCKVVVTDTDGTTITVTADGSLSAALDTLTWDLTVRVGLSGSPQGLVLNGSVHDSGKVTVTSTTAVGAMRREVNATASASGQSASLGMDESLDFDVTYDPALHCVTGGTLEAKRVWTQRPQGASTAQLQDRGAKVTWTGCGIATVAFSK
jgi:hypothetical protein